MPGRIVIIAAALLLAAAIARSFTVNPVMHPD